MDAPPSGVRRSVGVVIVAFNSGDFLVDCLDSVAAICRDKTAITTVVVDNASSDGTAARIREAFPTVDLIENSANLGFAAAANIGLRRVQDLDYALLLNPDTVVGPGVVDALVDYLESHPGAGIVSPRLVLQDGQIDPGCHRGFPGPWASFTYLIGLERLFPRWRLVNGYHRGDLDLESIHPVDAVSGAFMLIRISLLREIGLLDERFFMYTEDVDLCMRTHEAGYSVIYNPRQTVLHVKGTSSGIKRHSDHISQASFETRRRALNAFYDSTKLFYDKHYAPKYPRPLQWAVHLAVAAARPLANYRLRKRMQPVA